MACHSTEIYNIKSVVSPSRIIKLSPNLLGSGLLLLAICKLKILCDILAI